MHTEHDAIRDYFSIAYRNRLFKDTFKIYIIKEQEKYKKNRSMEYLFCMNFKYIEKNSRPKFYGFKTTSTKRLTWVLQKRRQQINVKLL